MPRADAQHRARLAYAAYVGFLQLNLQLQQSSFRTTSSRLMSNTSCPRSFPHPARHGGLRFPA